MSTKKVPCTAAPAGAPWTNFVAVDEVRTPPGRTFPDIRCSDIRARLPAIGSRLRAPENSRIAA